MSAYGAPDLRRGATRLTSFAQEDRRRTEIVRMNRAMGHARLADFRGGDNGEDHITIDLYVADGGVRLTDVTVGPGPRKFFGEMVDRDWEVYVTVRREHRDAVCAALGFSAEASDEELLRALQERWDGIRGVSHVSSWLEQNSVPFETFSW